MNQEYLTLMNKAIFDEVICGRCVGESRYGLLQQIPLGNARFQEALEYFTRKKLEIAENFKRKKKT